MSKQYIVCFSGGHSSALAAIETVRKYGKDNVILLNHDISPRAEHEDIKRFKQEIADYLGITITYANMEGWDKNDQLDVCVNRGAFKIRLYAVCTEKLKTIPFQKWLKANYPSKPFEPRQDVCIIYGFDKNEINRIQRRTGVLFAQGYLTDYPLALWDRTIYATEEIGIRRPVTYELYRHANCIPCIKAGKQQWYIVYCTEPEKWEKAKEAEAKIGYSILKEGFLKDFECKFAMMKDAGIIPTEKITPQRFWAEVRKELPDGDDNRPCECAV